MICVDSQAGMASCRMARTSSFANRSFRLAVQQSLFKQRCGFVTQARDLTWATSQSFHTVAATNPASNSHGRGHWRRQGFDWRSNTVGVGTAVGASVGVLVFGALQRRPNVAYAESAGHAQQTLISGDSSKELEEQAAKVFEEFQKLLTQWMKNLEAFVQDMLTRTSEALAPMIQRVKDEVSNALQLLGPKFEEALKHANDALDAAKQACTTALDWLVQRLQELLDAARPALAQAADQVSALSSAAADQAITITADAKQLLSSALERPPIEASSSPAKAAESEPDSEKAAPAPAPPLPAAAAPPSPPPAVDYYVEYGPYIVVATVVMAALGFFVSRRALSTMATNASPQVVKGGTSGAPPHKRRATHAGPLQANELSARLIREALPLLSSTPSLEAVGTPLLESRLVGGLAGGKGGRLNGEFNVRGPKGSARVLLRSEKGVVVGLTATLECGERVEIPIVTRAASEPGQAKP